MNEDRELYVDEKPEKKKPRLSDADLRRQELDDLKFVLSSRQGRRLIWRLLGMFRVFESSMTGNSTTFFNEGLRKAGLILLAEVDEADQNAYVKMMIETKKENEE